MSEDKDFRIFLAEGSHFKIEGCAIFLDCTAINRVSTLSMHNMDLANEFINRLTEWVASANLQDASFRNNPELGEHTLNLFGQALDAARSKGQGPEKS